MLKAFWIIKVDKKERESSIKEITDPLKANSLTYPTLKSKRKPTQTILTKTTPIHIKTHSIQPKVQPSIKP